MTHVIVLYWNGMGSMCGEVCITHKDSIVYFIVVCHYVAGLVDNVLLCCYSTVTMLLGLLIMCCYVAIVLPHSCWRWPLPYTKDKHHP